MIDPLLLALAVGLPIAARLCAAAAEVWVLCARTRLAVSVSGLPAGAEIGTKAADGTLWFVRIRGIATTEAVNSNDR